MTARLVLSLSFLFGSLLAGAWQSDLELTADALQVKKRMLPGMAAAYNPWLTHRMDTLGITHPARNKADQRWENGVVTGKERDPRTGGEKEAPVAATAVKVWRSSGRAAGMIPESRSQWGGAPYGTTTYASGLTVYTTEDGAKARYAELAASFQPSQESQRLGWRHGELQGLPEGIEQGFYMGCAYVNSHRFIAVNPEALDKNGEPTGAAEHPYHVIHRYWVVRSGATVGVFAVDVTGFDTAPFKDVNAYPVGAPQLAGPVAENVLGQWLNQLAAGTPALIALDTPHQPPAAFRGQADKWTFLQGDDFVLRGRVTRQGQPLANAEVALSLSSPDHENYDIGRKRPDGGYGGLVTSAGDAHRTDLATPLITNEQGEFTWRGFFAPHATQGDWTVVVQTEFSVPDNPDPVSAAASKGLVVREDPALTADQLRKNFKWLQDEWRKCMPAKGPIHQLGALDTGRAWVISLGRSVPAMVGLGYEPLANGPLNNWFAGRHGEPYVGFSCGGCTARTLDWLNSLRYCDDEATRKRLLGIAYVPVTHWPANFFTDYLYQHIAVMLYYDGYKRLQLSEPPLAVADYTEPARPGAGTADFRIGGMTAAKPITRKGFTTPPNAVVFEYWLNQTPDVMPVSEWIDNFTFGHLGIPTGTWGELCPVPGGNRDYTTARLLYIYDEGIKSGALFTGALRDRARALEILTLSPVTVLLTDGRGRRTGVTAEGELLCEIPGSGVDFWPGKDGSAVQHTVCADRQVQVQVTGRRPGKFGLLVNLPQADRILHYPKAQSLQPGAAARLEIGDEIPELVMPDGARVKPEVFTEPIPQVSHDAADYLVTAVTTAPTPTRPLPSVDAGMDLDAIDPDRPAVSAPPLDPERRVASDNWEKRPVHPEGPAGRPEVTSVEPMPYLNDPGATVHIEMDVVNRGERPVEKLEVTINIVAPSGDVVGTLAQTWPEPLRPGGAVRLGDDDCFDFALPAKAEGGKYGVYAQAADLAGAGAVSASSYAEFRVKGMTVRERRALIVGGIAGAVVLFLLVAIFAAFAFRRNAKQAF